MEFIQDHWRPCSSCKKPIGYRIKFYECSVSTCTGKRTGYVFCTVHCWERHLPGARHRDAAAIEKTSPSLEQWKAELANDPLPAANKEPQRRVVTTSTPQSASRPPMQRAGSTSMDNEILVVVSKMKTYVKEKADYNTSNDASEVLSHFIRRLCDDAIDRARADGRKTIMGKDFKL